ncbi:MAG TPA: hypothetical protein VJ826_02210, partial [Candidatus Polarisedimenticolaceae bacterium]|nr:hypothetical protein [Candidatus Polarisedimenticolaceae bacterium]
ESNPFYLPEPEGDIVARSDVFFGVILPFRNSYVRASTDATFRRYSTLVVDETTSNDLVGELSLLFGSKDRFVLRADYSTGADEVLRFDGGESTYDGTPYRFGVYTAGIERDVPGHLGYEAAFSWSSLRFDSTDVNFFEFDGYDVTGNGLFPVSPHASIVAGGWLRRYDHMLASDPTGAVFRQEHTDVVTLGMQGIFARGGVYRAVAGYDWSRYPGGVGSDYTGLIGDVAVGYAVGPSTFLQVRAARRPWSSSPSTTNNNNYYLAGTLGSSVQHVWRSGSELGGTLNVGRLRYPDPVSTAAGSPKRHDRLLAVEAHFVLVLQRWVALRFAGTFQGRGSNIPDGGYDASTIGAQLVIGWR